METVLDSFEFNWISEQEPIGPNNPINEQSEPIQPIHHKDPTLKSDSMAKRTSLVLDRQLTVFWNTAGVWACAVTAAVE